MTEIVAARLGFSWGWDLGEDAWKDGADKNFRQNDTLHGLFIGDDSLTAPPGSPGDGAVYIPAATATGAWATHEGELAAYQNGVWYFTAPVVGLRALFDTTGTFKYYNGSAWVDEPVPISSLGTLSSGQLIANSGSASAAAAATTLTALLDRVMSATTGAILTRGTTAWSAISPGTDGDVLTTHGTTDVPTWEAPGGGGGGVTGLTAGTMPIANSATSLADGPIAVVGTSYGSLEFSSDGALVKSQDGLSLLVTYNGNVAAIASDGTSSTSFVLDLGSVALADATGAQLILSGGSLIVPAVFSPTGGTLNATGFVLHVATPVNSSDAVTKGYVDALGGVTSVLGNAGSVTLSDLVTGGVAPSASPTLTGTVTLPANLAVTGGTLDATGFALNVGTPTASANAANKAYVDLVAQGLSPKPSAVWATAAALAANTYANGTAGLGATLTGNANGALSVDGGTPTAGDTVLVKNESSGLKNGLYIVTTVGDGSHAYVLTRHTSMDTTLEYQGAFIVVESQGTANPNTIWLCTNASAPTVGTTAVTFTQLNSPGVPAAGTGIAVSGTVVSLDTIATKTILSNTGTASAAPSGHTLSDILDAVLGSNVGAIISRGTTAWGTVAPGTTNQALVSNGTSSVPSFATQLWSTTAVTAKGNGVFINSGSISAQRQGTVTATTTGTIDPTDLTSCLVNIGTTNATLTVSGGFIGQHLRLEILQGATAHTVAFDTSVIFGADITSYTAGTVVAKRDLVQLIANTTSTWMFAAVNHSF